MQELYQCWWVNVLWSMYANYPKTWLIVTKTKFEKEGIQISKEGRSYIGASLGSRSFTEHYMQSKASE